MYLLIFSGWQLTTTSRFILDYSGWAESGPWSQAVLDRRQGCVVHAGWPGVGRVYRNEVESQQTCGIGGRVPTQRVALSPEPDWYPRGGASTQLGQSAAEPLSVPLLVSPGWGVVRVGHLPADGLEHNHRQGQWLRLRQCCTASAGDYLCYASPLPRQRVVWCRLCHPRVV